MMPNGVDFFFPPLLFLLLIYPVLYMASGMCMMDAVFIMTTVAVTFYNTVSQLLQSS